MSSTMKPRHQYTAKEDLTRAATLIILTFWLTTPLLFYLLRALPPKFSVQVADATGLDTPPPQDDDAPISTAFNITLHASNRRQSERCYRHGEAVVRYSGYAVAWGRTRAFCVGAREAWDVPVVAWGDGVGLSRSLRDRMAADRSVGAVELEVDVRLFRGDDGSARPTWMSCKVTARGGGAKPPGTTTPCTVFALQNWASDIAPAWMQYF